jgi:hypothetical protein
MPFRRADHVAWRKIGDETVLIHLKEQRMFVLNPSGGFLWHALDGARHAKDFLLLFSDLGPPPGPEATQVDGFLVELEGHGLLQQGPSGEAAAAQESAEGSEMPWAPPQVVWQEPIQNFKQFSCGFLPGQSGPCNTAPTT